MQPIPALQQLLDSKVVGQPMHKKNGTELARPGTQKLLINSLQRVQQASGSQHQAFGKNNPSTTRLNMQKVQQTLPTQLKTLNSERDPIELTVSLHYRGNKLMLTISMYETTTELFKKLITRLHQIDPEVVPKVRSFQTHASSKNINIDYYLSLDNEPLEVFHDQRSLRLEPYLCEPVIDNPRIQDFEIVKCIGVGGFSRVYLVRKKDDGQFYAMKLIDKYFILRAGKEIIINNERMVMGSVESPYLAKLYYAFESKYYLAFVVEYCAGGELFYHLRKLRRLDEELAKQYFAQVCLAVEYLHKQGIVYRDIKPENILLDLEGYIHLSDFGLSKPNMSRDDTAYSFCGSPEYMSPEMLLREGHNFMVDIYCLGALLYEFICGSPPFYCRNVNEIYKSILNHNIQFPPNVRMSAQAKDLIQMLLVKDPSRRLGSKEGVREILKHPWFDNFDFRALSQRRLNLKYKPYPLGYNFDEAEFSKGDKEFQEKLQDNLYRERLQKYEKYFQEFEFKAPAAINKRKEIVDQFLKSNSNRGSPTNKKNLSINTFLSSTRSSGSKALNMLSVRGNSNVQSMLALSFRPQSTKRFNTDIDFQKIVNLK